MQRLIYKPLKVHKFINIMEEYGFPFRLDISRAADFYISNGNSADNTYIFFCLPSCFDIADRVLQRKCPDLYYNIDTNIDDLGCLKGLNKRDLAIEVLNFIYVNPWEIHSAVEIGEPQRFVISVLERYGYINSEILNPVDIIYHTSILDSYVKSNKAFSVTNSNVPYKIYFIHFSVLPLDVHANIYAYFKYRQIYGEDMPDDIENSFYRIDTAHKVIQVINSKDALQFLNRG